MIIKTTLSEKEFNNIKLQISNTIINENPGVNRGG